MLAKGQGFTHAGVERINDSIRSYAWAILATQADDYSRTTIIGVGTAEDAQRVFREKVELIASIKSYEC